MRKLERMRQTLPQAGGGPAGGMGAAPAGGTSASGGDLRQQGSDEPSGAVVREGRGGAGPTIHKPRALALRDPEGRDATTGDNRRGDQTTSR